MKKFTFLAAFALAMSMNAYSQDQVSTSQEWTDELTTVGSESDFVRSTAIAMDADNNTIVTGRYSLQENLQFGLYTFTGITANDAFIGKYDKYGRKQWVAGINGNAVFTAVATDEQGNIYAAGKFAAVAKLLGTNDTSKEITDGDPENTSRTSAFLAKYSKDGVLLGVEAYKAEIDESLVPEGCTSFAEANVTINQIQVEDGKVYLSITHKGTVKIGDEVLTGNYYTAWGMYFFDSSTADIVYLNATNFEEGAWVATIGAENQVESEVSYQPESICFTVDNGVVYLGFTGMGSLKLDAMDTDVNCDFDYSDDGVEHGFVFARITNTGSVASKIYDTLPTSSYNSLNSVDCMKLVDGKLCVAGTYNVEGLFGGLEFKGGCDTYVALLDGSTLETISAKSSGYDEGDANKTAEVVTSAFTACGSLFVTGYAENTSDHSFLTPMAYKVDLTTGEMSPVDNENYITATAQSGKYIVSVAADKYTYDIECCDEVTAGINDVNSDSQSIVRNGDTVTLSEPSDITVYSADGALVASAKASTSISLAGLAKGVYVVKAGQKTVKVNK